MQPKTDISKLHDIIDITDICNVLGVGRNTAYSLLKNNDIASKKIKRKYIILKKALSDISIIFQMKFKKN